MLPLRARGTPCVLTAQTHTGLPRPLQRQYNSTHSHNTVNLLCGVRRTQWGNRYRNTTSTQYFLIPSPSSPPYLHHPTRETFYSRWWTVDAIFILRDRNTPRTDTSHIHHRPLYSTSHLQSPEESQHIDDEGRASGVVWSPAITQPQETHSREQTTPHTGGGKQTNEAEYGSTFNTAEPP